jgi:O-antigen/teichoic acid export membrane protein
LYPPPKEKDPYIPYYIAAAVISAVGFACIVAYFAMKLKRRRGFIFYQSGNKEGLKEVIFSLRRFISNRRISFPTQEICFRHSFSPQIQ